MVAEAPCTADCDPQQRDTPRTDKFLYFSFGSNLLEERIHVQIKGATFMSIGVLNDYELVFFDCSHRWQGALASIEKKVGSHVWGCVWQVPNLFADELDRQESGYHRLEVDIFVNASEFHCRTYQYSNKCRVIGWPSPHYKQVIVAGAIEHALPSGYIGWLQQIPTNGYKGPVELNLKAIKSLNSEFIIANDTEAEVCEGA